MNVSWLVAFAAGMGSLLSPCVVPLVPSYLSAMAGGTLDPTLALRRRIVGNALGFIAGFSLVLVVSGMMATQIGAFLHTHERLVAQLGGLVVMLFALQVLGVIQLSWLNQEKRLPMTAGPGRFLGAVLLGVVFAAGWTPCVGPVWGSILLLASQKSSVAAGGLLLFVYAMGMALPLFLLAVFFGQATRTVHRIQRYLPWIERATGSLLLLLGLALVTGFYSAIPSLMTPLIG